MKRIIRIGPDVSVYTTVTRHETITRRTATSFTVRPQSYKEHHGLDYDARRMGIHTRRKGRLLAFADEFVGPVFECYGDDGYANAQWVSCLIAYFLVGC